MQKHHASSRSVKRATRRQCRLAILRHRTQCVGRACAKLEKFKQNYAREHLDSDTRPSIRLLSLVSNALFDEKLRGQHRTRGHQPCMAHAHPGGVHELVSLHSEGWSLDEALHEMTKVRSDMPALLQPRAKPVAPLGKGGKGKGRKGDKGKKGVIPAITKFSNDPKTALAMHDLATKHGNRTLCLRCNRQQCTNKQCKYSHLCAIKLLNGQVCGQKHPAFAHKFKHGTASEGAAVADG